MKKTILTIVIMATFSGAFSQTEEETLVWFKDYGRNLAFSLVYRLSNDGYTKIHGRLYIDIEKNILDNPISREYYNRELQPIYPSSYDGFEVGYADLQHLYIKPVEGSTFYRVDKSDTYFKYDYSFEGNKKFTGEKVAYYSYTLEFSKPVVRYYLMVNAERNYQGSGGTSLTLYFTNLEDAQRVIKAINHLAKLQGAKPKPQVKKSMF
ncbi:hypothetical protein V1387_13350 [Allomuricauda taeanensis]|uniref:hypothetical protein n=1 Tax=Flagellimonas taeanensis TaxID=1005926 RepID=UPI002E7AB563|nr:hypothetical protein [Allomuricauda taeanensis]MEE1963676.1 hypothetical protein [Allomuricauda taeanensis]